MNNQLSSQLDQLADYLAQDGFAVIDNFLSDHEIDSILSTDGFQSGLLQFKKAGIGKTQEKQINESIRGDYIQWIDPITAALPLVNYLNKLDQLRISVNRNLFLSLKDCEVHQTIYPIGSFYKRHLDQFKKDDHRKLSVITYLNKSWNEENGGQLRLYINNEIKDILPLAGRLVCFRSDLLEHEVFPATRERLSLTGWLIDKLV